MNLTVLNYIIYVCNNLTHVLNMSQVPADYTLPTASVNIC